MGSEEVSSQSRLRGRSAMRRTVRLRCSVLSARWLGAVWGSEEAGRGTRRAVVGGLGMRSWAVEKKEGEEEG